MGKQQDPSRTEYATQKRRDKARKDGNVPKSQEASKTMSVFSGLIILLFYFPVMVDHFKVMIFYIFGIIENGFDATSQSVYALLIWIAFELAIILLPVLLFIAFCGYLILRLQVGKLWIKVFKFNWGRFNIISALKGMLISPQTIVRLLKSLALALIIGMAPLIVLRQEFEHFLPMYYASPELISQYMLQTAVRMVKYALIPMGCIAAFDVWYTRWSYEEGLKMTKEEVRDERRNAEGDPVIKARQRQEMMKFLLKRMMQDVPRANVVVTNPTHIAVALRYDTSEAPAPVVLAKGAGAIAQKIKDIARENHIPIRENVPLARALYKSVEIGAMIPEDLYKAVAAVLAEIWRLKARI